MRFNQKQELYNNSHVHYNILLKKMQEERVRCCGVEDLSG